MTINASPPSLKVSPQQAHEQTGDCSAVIIDVRDPQKYQQEHIPGAISIPVAALTAEQLPEGKSVILYCGSGNSAGRTMERLRSEGHMHVASLDGGITNWKSAGLPTAKSLELYSFDEIKSAVAKRYGAVATDPDRKFNFPVGRQFAESVGYEAALLNRLPSGLWESYTGAGNPQPFVDARPGETILDLGCGAGLDLSLYAQQVGPTGKVYGLDLSEAMLKKAQANFAEVGYGNAEFLHASADAIPLRDSSVDLVTANGIYNLSPDKDAVMREVARVLKPGGRTVFAEIVLKSELPCEIRREISDWFRCIGGALVQEDFLSRLEQHGLSHPQILWSGRNARTGHELALSAVIRAEKPT